MVFHCLRASIYSSFKLFQHHEVVLLLAASIMMFSFAHVTTLKVDTAANNINWVGYKVTGKHRHCETF